MENSENEDPKNCGTKAEKITMGTKIKISVLIGLMIVSLAPNAIADKVCLKTTVDKRTFKVTNKVITAAQCPSGYTWINNDNAVGLNNLGACRRVTNTCRFAAGSVGNCGVRCTQGKEFVLQPSSNVVPDYVCVPEALSPIEVYNAVYTNGLGYGVNAISTATCPYTLDISAMCCPIG